MVSLGCLAVVLLVMVFSDDSSVVDWDVLSFLLQQQLEGRLSGELLGFRPLVSFSRDFDIFAAGDASLIYDSKVPALQVLINFATGIQLLWYQRQSRRVCKKYYTRRR